MSQLRQQMIRDMQLKRFSPRTQASYLYAVTALARYYKQSPDKIDDKQIQDYLLFLMNERKLSWSTCDLQASGIEFFRRVTMNRPGSRFSLPRRQQAQRLPEVLSTREVENVLGCVKNLKHRVMLMTTYDGGLRLNEVLHLKVTDVDGQRMMIRVEQGKGNKDRYTVLSKRLLEELRVYWKIYRPTAWLFPGRDPNKPLHETSLQKVFQAALKKAGIRKPASVHTLRHCFATHLLEANVDVRRIQNLMGHKHIQTTMRYMQVTQKHVGSTPGPLDLLERSA